MPIPVDPEKTLENEPTVENEPTTEEADKLEPHPHSSDYRSAATGQFVTEAEAEADPDRTVKES